MGVLRSGAEVLAGLLEQAGCRTVFAYPGTSELAVCAAVAGRNRMRLVNARGDREAVFMAAGGNLDGHTWCAALLHGARGLTNALGAIADVRRSEVATLCLVGMPSRASARFLPPHGEPGLIAAAGAFAAAAFDCSIVAGHEPRQFLDLVGQAMAALRALPAGPVLLGLPHDLLTGRFVPPGRLAGPPPLAGYPPGPPPGSAPGPAPGRAQVDAALALLRAAQRPVVLVDDYLLRYPAAEAMLGRLAAHLGAPVLQVAYRRGPMLFQRVRPGVVATFVGPYDPADAGHRDLMASADLLITVEDRNMYPRVVGRLPACPKVAVTSNAAATAKNGYLHPADPVLGGDVRASLAALAEGLAAAGRPAGTVNGRCRAGRGTAASGVGSGSAAASALARALATGLHAAGPVWLVDDSQMMGGLLAGSYRDLPESIRIFASHGAFVGGGLATAVGLAAARHGGRVVVLLGDQGFTNGVQALAAVGALQVPLLVVVCNNGASVSLGVQAAADGVDTHLGAVLGNVPGMSYAAIAQGFGLPARVLRWADPHTAEMARQLTGAIADALNRGRPQVLELIVPGSAQFWAGVWRVAGFDDETAPDPTPAPAGA